MAETIEQEPLVVEAPPLVSPVYGLDAGDMANTLGQIPEVDLQLQGEGQVDISIRGGNFSGAGIAIQGLALPNAQTEHFHAELPFSTEWFAAPEVLTGFRQAVGGGGYLVGTLDFKILPIVSRRLLVGGISEHESYAGEVLVDQQFESGSKRIGVGGFASGARIQSVDFSDNDIDVQRAGGRFQVINNEGDQTDFLVGHQVKDFGVRGYYGVTPDWYGEEKTEDTLLYLGTIRQRETLDLHASAYYRIFEDQYRLYWSLPGLFENRHTLHSAGGMLGGRWHSQNNYWVDFNVNAHEERIRSGSLGDFDRQRVGASAIPGIRLGAWKYQVGLETEVYSDFDNMLLPHAAVTYYFDDDLHIQLAYSESVRQPSYTELNYESPASLGNAGLDTQVASTSELLLRGKEYPHFSWQIGVFYRTTRDTVDWIRRDAVSTRWEAENIGTVDALGVEAMARWQHQNGNTLSVFYQGLDLSTDAEVYASRYALDYAKHLLRIRGRVFLGKRLAVDYSQTFREQAPNRLRESESSVADGRVQVLYQLLHAPQVYLQVAVDNVWDDDYQVYPGQETVSARRYSSGVRVIW
jgi:iron complex outermembrane receptor protein